MTIFEMYISGALDTVISKKILKGGIIDYCKIYAKFIEFRAGGAKYQPALFLTAEQMNTSEKTVRRAIATVNK
jgi:hypothetical protein